MRRKVDRPGVRQGYDRWSSSYDRTPNPLHPEMVAAGTEANFEDAGTEYRLGAVGHTVADYLNVIEAAGFRRIAASEYCGDRALAAEIPQGAKYLDRPLLLAVEACKP